MEILTELSAYINEIILFVTAIFGAVLVAIRSVISRIGLALLAGIGRGAGSGLGGRLTGGGAQAGQMGARRMPQSPRTRQARQALWQASAREKRMNTYITAWCELLAMVGGPFALSVHLLGRIQTEFQVKVKRLQDRCKVFDRLEDRAQRVLQRYEADYERVCEPVRNEILAYERSLASWKARHRRWRFKFWRKRWRHNKRNMIAIRRRIASRQLKLFRKEYKLNLGYRTILEPVLKSVDDYERTYLSHWVYSFEADLKSFRLTVVSGRLIDLLYGGVDRRFLQDHGLGDLPEDAGALLDFLKRALDQYGIGYAPEITCESLFEAYLRAKLLSEPELCTQWGLSRIWIETALPPPGGLGIANAQFYHLGANNSWLPAAVKQATGLARSQPAA